MNNLKVVAGKIGLDVNKEKTKVMKVQFKVRKISFTSLTGVPTDLLDV